MESFSGAIWLMNKRDSLLTAYGKLVNFTCLVTMAMKSMIQRPTRISLRLKLGGVGRYLDVHK